MTRRQVGVTLALVVCSAVLVAVPVMGLGGAVPAQTDNTTNDTNGSFGQQVSSFMQASAVDANTTVESGMWQASVNQTIDASGDPAPKVTSRTAHLERKLQRLQDRTDRLQAQRESMPEVAYTARASALREQIANLKDQINETAQTATRVGVNTSNLDRLRMMAGNATGPEISAMARGITDAPRGPPAGVPGNGGPPGERGDGPPDERGGGPPGAADGTNRTDGGGQGNSPAAGSNGTGAAGSDGQSPSSQAGGANRTNGTSGSGQGSGPSQPDGGSDQPGDGPPDDSSAGSSGDGSSGTGQGS